MTIRTEQIYLRSDPKLAELCHFSNNLYNEANYIIRQTFFNTREWIRYNTLNWIIKDVTQSNNYNSLPAQTSQQILKLLDKNWTSFFSSIKDWKKHPEKYLGKPKPPKYKQKNGEFLLLFTSQQVKLKEGFVRLPSKLGQIKTRITQKLRGARILPQGRGYLLEILYKKEQVPLKEQKNRIIGIDLGLENLITMVNNIGLQPIVVNGKSIKAMNQLFNKRNSKLQSIYDRTGVKNGKKQQLLFLKRKKRIKDRLHKASRLVIDFCLKNNIDTLVIGYNKEWKQKINLGKKTNQKFVNIPFYTLLEQLKYKCEGNGIHFIKTEESYTSKCSFLDNEPIKKYEKYQGKRIKRGLFRSGKNFLINADVNAAYNIIKKVVPNALVEGIAGKGLYPKRINLFV